MDPALRRAQLLKAALKVFADHGIGAANHTAIATAAGVAVPTMFHYFATKEEIVDAALAEVSRFLLDELLAGNDDASVPATAAVRSILLAFCDSIDSEPDYARVWLEWSVSVREGLWDRYLVFHRGAIKGIRNVLKRGLREGSIRKDVNIDDAARVVVGLAHMVAQMKFSGASRKQVARTVSSLVNGYLEAPAYE